MHVGVVLLLLFHSGIVRLFEPKPEVVVPVEFVVDTTPLMPDVSEVLPDMSEPETEPEPEPQTIPEPEPKPRPRKKIEVSRKKITRSNAPKPKKQKQLSEEEIRKLLAAGAKPSDHTSVPDEDARCFSIIKDALHAAWEQPSAEAAGDAVAVLRITLGRDGTVKRSDLHKSSGNPALDSSVKAVGINIHRIHGLTGDFIRRHSSVTVSFTVD